VSIDGLQKAPKTAENARKYRHPKIGMPTRIFLKVFRDLMWKKIPSGPTFLTVSAEIACWARSREYRQPAAKMARTTAIVANT
jgi:hypothetical protein